MARILIADDDPQAGEMIARICTFKGHEVEQARDAQQALEAFERWQPDVVITDLAMPGGGGQHLIKEIRATDAGAACPVIVISGYTALLDEQAREDLQPCTILEKPLDLHPMLTALDAALIS